MLLLWGTPSLGPGEEAPGPSLTGRQSHGACLLAQCCFFFKGEKCKGQL